MNPRIILLSTSLAIPGCIVVPFPNSRVEGYGVISRVVDADNGHPIAGAKVVDATDETRTVTTDASGKFQLEPMVRWHFGYLYGVVSYPIWPFTHDLLLPHRSISIVAAGYDEATFLLDSLRPDPKRGDTRTNLPMKDNFFLPPSLPLHKPSAAR